jgi:hypothetical protein
VPEYPELPILPSKHEMHLWLATALADRRQTDLRRRIGGSSDAGHLTETQDPANVPPAQ